MKLQCKRIMAMLLVLAMVLTVLPTMAFAAEKTGDTVILYTNDVHCSIDAKDGTMGYANLAAYKKAMQAEHESVLLVDAGDAVQGGAIGTLSKGEYLVDIMNAVGYDYATYGNHEFDYGMDQAMALVEKANAKYLSCNFIDLKTNETVSDAYDIVDTAAGKVAIIGISTPETFTKSTPAYFQDDNYNYIYSFCQGNNGQDLYDAVQKSIDAAKTEGVDYVIALGHLGVDTQSSPWMSTDVIANTTGLDAFIDGHSHSTIPSQEVEDKEGNTVVLSSTGTKLANIGKLTISADGEITTELVSGYTDVDEEADTFIKGIKAEHESLLNTVVAHTDVDLTTLDPETGMRAVRSAETNLGDLCADAYRTLLDADIAFVNGGGIREDIKAGDITYQNIINVHPYGNEACSIKVTGETIWEALELGAASYPGESGGFLQVSGLKYTICYNVPSPVVQAEDKTFLGLEGEHRVVDVQVLSKETGKYEPLDVNKEYVLASHNYMLLNGGDGYTMFRGAEVVRENVMLDNEVLIRYIVDTLGGNVGEEYANPYGQGRITVSGYTDVPADAYYAPYVEALTYADIVNGTSATTFSPDRQLTRAQAATLLWRLTDLSADEIAEEDRVTFSDVQDGQYYTDAVTVLASAGIINGYPDGTFHPNAPITRQELATLMCRLAEHWEVDVAADTEAAAAAKDWDQVQSYAKPAMAWAVENGIINGTSLTELVLSPNSNTTRGQAAVMLVRYIVYVDENLTEPDPQP